MRGPRVRILFPPAASLLWSRHLSSSLEALDPAYLTSAFTGDAGPSVRVRSLDRAGAQAAFGEAQIGSEREGRMLAMWVKVRVKPEERERFLKAIEVDALGSERDEAGCMQIGRASCRERV